jgi:hypothetical protein
VPVACVPVPVAYVPVPAVYVLAPVVYVPVPVVYVLVPVAYVPVPVACAPVPVVYVLASELESLLAPVACLLEACWVPAVFREPEPESLRVPAAFQLEAFRE